MKNSDSCFHGSCILDWEENISEDERDEYARHSDKPDSKVGGVGFKQFRRASSCDTSIGIDDIEDFEVDGFDDLDLPLEDEIVVETFESVVEVGDKRINAVMTSPDLAYGSLEESFHHLEIN